jgi:hypothetical protein
MRFSLDIEAGHFFFDTLPDLSNALQIANAFKPFEENCEFRARVSSGDHKLDLLIVGIKFSDHISFGLSDKSRKDFDAFREAVG